MASSEYEFFTARESASRLNISLRGLANLRDAAILSPPLEIGRQMLYPQKDILELASRKVLEPPYERAYIVRVSPKQRANEPDREWLGYSAAGYSNDKDEDSDEVMRKALSGWWPVGDPDRYLGYPLVATLASFVVWAAKIVPGGDHRAGRFRFNTAPLEPVQEVKYLNHRLRLEKGAISIAVGFD
jgi:hypothetical protein